MNPAWTKAALALGALLLLRKKGPALLPVQREFITGPRPRINIFLLRYNSTAYYRAGDSEQYWGPYATNWNDALNTNDKVAPNNTSEAVRRIQSALNQFCHQCSGKYADVCRVVNSAGQISNGSLPMNGLFNGETRAAVRAALPILGYQATDSGVVNLQTANENAPAKFPNTPEGLLKLADALEIGANVRSYCS